MQRKLEDSSSRVNLHSVEKRLSLSLFLCRDNLLAIYVKREKTSTMMNRIWIQSPKKVKGKPRG